METLSDEDLDHVIRVMNRRKIIPGKNIVCNDRLVDYYEISRDGREIEVMLKASVKSIDLKIEFKIA